MTYSIFKNQTWFTERYDARKKIFAGISKEDFELAKNLHFKRVAQKNQIIKTKTQIFKEDLHFFSQIPYEIDETLTGWEDYCYLQRESSNGKGWVAISGESANNYYTDEPHLVAALRRKYNVWKNCQ